MILSWMSYAIVVGVLIAVAATAVDHVAATRRLPSRFVWAGAIGLALVWPIATTLRALLPTLAPEILPLSVTVAPLRVVSGAGASGLVASIDAVLVVVWAVASSLLVAQLVADIITLRRMRRHWPVREIDGLSMRLTADVGPAVIGLRSMEVVLPEWILSLDEPLRALVLRHEEEHRVARDPHLLIAARLAIALAPWNPAIWYAAHRLRLAIELDCDARVLRAHPSPQRYGMLLLTIAQRRATVPMALSPMLSEPTTQLERRILAMRPSRRRLARVTAVAGVLVAAGALALACSVQSDAPPTASRASTAPRAAVPRSVGNASYFEFQVEKPAAPIPSSVAPRYPDVLRKAKVEGEVVAQFVVDTTGRADMKSFKVVKSSNALFTNAVKSALANTKFHPAEVGGRKVRQLLQMPFVFGLHK
jgi:TonB family protein